ncbi:polysaccharide pyruvyl transferase family protein [Zhihengliuella flava]|uniref:Polysaccharide pyruvyl transferase WcaK-like protein n=1 Tax=Zhihengliuella flava TaxID=1285193 RepID=A0A931D9W9_9MICC|nr:polysaccharide pyruvyl transferase family protein [Zhihengliuella flava]MBG6083516.1 polysaccharide pyruvyl transferase WcaK-like protein [Zhihengliuella flava]
MRTRKKIGLIGFFGWGNYGDELFLNLWKDRLGGLFDAEPINTKLAVPYFDEPAEQVAEKYDAFIIGGGDLVIPSKISQLYWDPAWLAKPVYIAGVGVPTWITHENKTVVKKMREFFRHPNVKSISARDEESAEWIRTRLRPRVPVRVSPDLVFSMDMPEPRSYPQKTLGVVVRYRRSGADDYSNVATLAAAARKEGYSVVAIVLGTGQTGQADVDVARTLPFDVDEIIHSESIDEISSAIGGLDALASMKFHGTVVAASYGVPTIVLSPTSKSQNLYRLLDRSPLLSHLEDEDVADKLPLTRLRVPDLLIDELHRRSDAELRRLVDQIQRENDPAGYAQRLATRTAHTAASTASSAQARLGTALGWRLKKLRQRLDSGK